MTTTNPKKIKCACHSRTTTCLQSDSDYLLKKTCFLLKDDFGCKMVKRQVDLLENYIRISSGGILLKDVKYLLLVLEYLAKHSEEVQEYQPLLVSLLKLFHLPPLLHESDITNYEKYLKELFTVLGFLIVLLHDIKLQWYAISAISCLLNASSHDKKAQRVNFKTCLKAAENSQLSTIVGQLLEVIDSRLYPSLTYLALQLCINSIKCSWKIGATGALDFLLLRMNKKYPIFNTSSDIDVCMLQDSNLFSLLWTLLRAAQMKPSDAPGWPNISMQALWCLRTWLRYATCNNLRYIRNSVVALIILLIEVFPEVLIVLSGLAQDLVTLAIVRELGAEDDWVHGLEMSKDQLDFDFKKLVILSVCYLARYPSAIYIMKSRHVAKSLVLLVEPGYLSSSSQWGRSHLWSLLISALQALSVLTPFLLEDLVQSSASTRLLLLLEWHTQQPYDYSVLVPCLTAMVHLTVQRQEHLIENIYDQGGFSTVLRICLKLMTKSFLSLEDQHVMSICLTILEQICRDHGSIQELHGSPVINLVTSFIKKETTNPSMVPVDDRLVICLLDLLWECVVWCPKNCELFVKIGGVFLLLDLLKSSIFPVQILLLAVLTDLTEQGDCVPHFVTWRDAQGKGYLPLLMDIWREEEQRIGVPRGRYGMIKDTAIPLMGKAQYNYTYIFKKDMSSSPAVVDIYASARPKIYGIIQMLGHRHKDVVEEVQAHYQMYHNTLCSEDKVIFQVVKNYLALKMAEVWAEVSQDMEAQGLVPLETDDTVVKVLSQRLNIWGEYIQALQRIILEELKVCTEDNIRRKLILDSEKTKDLHTKQELEVVAASMDPEFRAMKSKFESSQVSVTFPDDIPDDQCHITYEAHSNHKMLLNQHVGILDGGIEALDVSPFEKWDWRYFNFAAEEKQSLTKTGDFPKCQYN